MAGALQLMMMRKQAAGGPYSFTGWSEVVDDNASGTATVTATFQTDGSLTFAASTGDAGGLTTSGITHWHDGGTVAGIGNSRWARRTLISGDTMTSGISTTTPTALSTARNMAISLVTGEGRSGTYRIDFYSDPGGTNKVGELFLTQTAVP